MKEKLQATGYMLYVDRLMCLIIDLRYVLR